MKANIILLAKSIKADPTVADFERVLCDSLIESVAAGSVFARILGDMLVELLPQHKLTPELAHQLTQV